MRYPTYPPMHPLLTPEEAIEKQLIKDTPLNDFPTIKEFYGGREIFITGGSGFIGKVLIEKLLRSCPDIKTIFLLLRPKRGKAIEDRLKLITELPLFDLLRIINPEFHQKLVPIAGDVAELKLGLSDEDVHRMKDVSIIFHSAASVRFDDSLKYAVLMNTRGTREVMRFAEKLQNIKLVMHVSTTYSNVYIHTVEEKIYPAAADWGKTIEICEKLDDDQLALVTAHYTNFVPNTYVFSKNLAEHVTNDYKDKLPVVLFRPAIVICAQKEPLPGISIYGWVDNFNGPMGILLASLVGISKTMYCDPNTCFDFFPVDVCIKAMIIAAWKRAHEPRELLTVYNGALGKHSRATIKQLLEMGIKGLCKELPAEKTILVPSGGVTLSKTLNLIRLFFYQIIPAVILDMVLKYKKQKPILMNLQRKIFEGNRANAYFATHNWEFINDNFVSLCSFLRLEDIREFEFRDVFTFDVVLSQRNYIMGFRRYLLKEKDETLPASRRRYRRMQMSANIARYIFYLILFYLAFFKYKIFDSIRNQFELWNL